MSEVCDAEVLRKLEQIKEIRTKMVQLEKIKTKVKSECSIMDNEDHCLHEYKNEMELLLQEKMAHVEELRLIHADINLMETTIKQSEEERNKALDNARMLFEEQRLLKEQLEVLRSSLGLEPSTLVLGGDQENQDENDENIVVKLYEKNKLDYHHHHHHHHHQLFSASGPSSTIVNQSEQQSSFMPGGGAPTMNLNPLGPPQPSHHPIHHHHLPQVQKTSDHSRGVGSQEGLSSSGMAAFRQQPPPMKACLSCHQQIHRNAPICPLCKAKSRSRNPKKPKRKMEE